ncbi:MAG: lysophospholipid acyltransferase family protein, partial [Propionivibrio sp.]
FSIPVFGACLRRAGHFSVELEDIRSQFRSMAVIAKAVREQGLSAFVFPEGSRSSGALDPFKEGAAYIAIKAQVPVIPVAICGTGRVVAPGSIHIRGHRIGLHFGKPISTNGLDTKDRTKLTQQMYDAVAALAADCEAATA